jgi:phage-related minor tail protein
MANKEKNVVLNFKMDGQVQYADTLREINSVMNTAAKEYKNHIAAMGKDAKATDKLAAEKKKLEIQMQAAEKRTGMLRAQYEAMSKDTKTTTGQLTQMYSKLLDAERAESSLQKAMERVNDGLSDQAQETRDAEDALKELKNESERLEAEQKKLTSSFELQSSELGENASEADKVGLAQRQLKNQMAITERAVQTLEKQLEQTKKAYGENSVEVFKMEAKLNEARTTVNKFRNSLREVEKSSNEAQKSVKELGNGMQGLAGAVPAAAIGGLVQSMQEYNEVLARLRTNAAISGRDLGIVEESFSKITAVTGEADAAGETLANLLASGFSENQLAEVIDHVNGAYIKFSDTLKTEGIADGIQETLAAGEAVGPFAELLERSGVKLENFNSTLGSMISIGEGSNYILKTLSQQGFSDVYDKYQELNPEVQANAEANAEMQQSLAELALVLTPMVTEVAEFTTKLIEWANENPRLTAGIAVITGGIGALIGIVSVLAPIFTATTLAVGSTTISFGALMSALLPIIGVIAAVTAVIVGIILLIKNWGSITDWLAEKWYQTEAMFRAVFASIVSNVMNALDIFDSLTQGKFKSITDTIRKYMTMSSEVISTILNFMENTFRNGLRFIKALLTGDFEGMYEAVSDQMGNIESTISDIWGSVMSFFRGIDLWAIGKDIIGGFVRGFTSIDIPTPHFDFDINWKDLPGPAPSVPYPTVSVDWRAKGAIFTQPTIFGQYGGRLQGAGDAGPEAALPLNEQTLGDIGKGIAATMKGVGGLIIQMVTPDKRVLAEMVVDDVTEMQNSKDNINKIFEGG